MLHRIVCKAFLTVAALAAAPVAFGAEYFSAHFCQPYRNGGEPQVQSYYQNQGSILAVAESAHVCPLSGSNLSGTLHVRVYYASPGVSAQPPITCRLWKISASNQTLVGSSVQGLVNQQANFVDVYSNAGPDGTIGAKVECILKPQVKILGYYLY